MKQINKLFRISLIQHSLFWVLSFYFIGSYFSISNTLKAIDFVYAAFFHISLLPLVYINIKILTPKFLNEKQYGIYGIAAILNIGLAIFLHEGSFEILIPSLPIDYYIVSFTDSTLLFGIYAIYTLLTTLLKLSRSWFRIEELEKENLALELSSLRFQINPHFLLNTLNSIYALALKQSPETSRVILRLSNMLKHLLYPNTRDLIPLKKELDHLTDYVELQKLRFENNGDIEFLIQGKVDQQNIAPLLLMTFFENSFKHGIGGKATGGYAHFKLDITEHVLKFSSKNNTGNSNQTPGEGGIGLPNVKRRLDLIYPGKHSLTILHGKKEFEVTLTLEL